MSIACIVLAAGSSQRLGVPKQTVAIAGETLLQRALRVAREADLRPVFAVLDGEGRFAQQVRGSGATIVLNHEADEGISSSIRAGVRAALALPNTSGVVVMTCDQVAVTPEHLKELCAAPEEIAGSGYAGKIAVPAYFPRAAFDKLMSLQGDTGARQLLRAARYVVAEELAIDVDTPADVARAEQLLNDNAGA